MDGLEAGRRLRADPVTKGLRMLALSSNNLVSDTDNFFATGFDGYLDRSLDIRQLPGIVRGYLSDEESP
jgi:CheY-like chemotaxis protein